MVSKNLDRYYILYSSDAVMHAIKKPSGIGKQLMVFYGFSTKKNIYFLEDSLLETITVATRAPRAAVR
jgi:hypothetical protein